MNGKVKLISSDNEIFVLDYPIATQSLTLKSFFSRPSMFIESVSMEVALPIKAKYLKRVVNFLEFKHLSNLDEEISEFKVEGDETLELLDVAAYLKI